MPVIDPNTQLAFSTVRLWVSWSVIPQLKEIAQIIWHS
jgi:hypothetical protein